MLTTLILMSVLTFGQPVSGFDLEGNWSQSVSNDIVVDAFTFKPGGEDFSNVKFEPSRRARMCVRQIEFNKDGTGKYVETVSEKRQEFTFRFVTGVHTLKEHYVFIAFDKPFLEQEQPLLVLVAKIDNTDQIVLTAVKKNSPLGDRINRISFDRQAPPASK